MRPISLLLLMLLIVAVGCGDSGSKDVVVPINEVPAPLMKVAQDALPDITFDHARKKPNGVYEIRGKNKQGKVREVEVSPEGKVLDIE